MILTDNRNDLTKFLIPFTSDNEEFTDTLKPINSIHKVLSFQKQKQLEHPFEMIHILIILLLSVRGFLNSQ